VEGEVKWTKREVEHSPPSNVEVKNEWSYTSAPSVCHHDMERDKRQLLLTLSLILPCIPVACFCDPNHN
jgi:hypothetical protein